MLGAGTSCCEGGEDYDQKVFYICPCKYAGIADYGSSKW